MNSTMPFEPASEGSAFTLATLFDDVIDAEHVLAQLRRSQQPAASISVILREQVLKEDDELNPYRTVLSEVIAQSSLEAAGKWLKGLASLILPDRAAYLSAGPVGQILSTIRDTMQSLDTNRETNPLGHEEIRQLTQTFMLFGFDRDEANYMEQRIVVGSAFIAITTTDTSQLRKILHMLRKSMPVHIGLARTETSVYRRASELLETGPRGLGAVVIADAVSPLDHVSSSGDLKGTRRDFRGRMVRSRYGEAIGRAEDLLYEPNPVESADGYEHDDLSDAKALLRYVIVRTSRRPGLGRKTIALPGDRIRIENGELVADATYEELVRAPRYESDSSMSRQDEATIRRHFSSPFYWITDSQ